jgi:hypothetical protein
MAAMRTPQEVIVAVAERSGGEDTRVAPEWEEKKIPATLRTSGRRTLAVFLGCQRIERANVQRGRAVERAAKSKWTKLIYVILKIKT